MSSAGLPLSGPSKTDAGIPSTNAIRSSTTTVGFRTGASFGAAKVTKSNLMVAVIGGFFPPIPLTSINADERGYVAVNFGGNPFMGFVLLGPDGSSVGDGDGDESLLGESSAYVP